MGKQRPDRPGAAEPAAPNAFAALASLRGTLPEGQSDEPAAPDAGAAPFAGKIVIARERKGRGGKTATLVRGVALAGPALEAFAREMRQALGTGGGVEGGDRPRGRPVGPGRGVAARSRRYAHRDRQLKRWRARLQHLDPPRNRSRRRRFDFSRTVHGVRLKPDLRDRGVHGVRLKPDLRDRRVHGQACSGQMNGIAAMVTSAINRFIGTPMRRKSEKR